ncbi:hypothetical protein ACFQY7_34465 [Actinomadura luteofluorescens]|uniref:Uncharacterized protein n=1 Tax=Actinomadura luteofluorescens TaxID=46163 RepID=A0A7Y9EL27_9ACTN|nr:hypothetical protein [Actinomadura luteofluorescens]NYD49130.1 hypothetical protein [Actinomadura luteofluorescens]
MPHIVRMSGDPKAAARQALIEAATRSQSVELCFTGTLDDVFEGDHHQDLTVPVNLRESVETVVARMREEAQNQQR